MPMSLSGLLITVTLELPLIFIFRRSSASILAVSDEHNLTSVAIRIGHALKINPMDRNTIDRASMTQSFPIIVIIIIYTASSKRREALQAQVYQCSDSDLFYIVLWNTSTPQQQSLRIDGLNLMQVWRETCRVSTTRGLRDEMLTMILHVPLILLESKQDTLNISTKPIARYQSRWWALFGIS
jgi:hypothetical protein